MKKTCFISFWLALAILLLFPGVVKTEQEAETGLLRFPAVHGDEIAFSYAGDLYLVGTGGGVARKITQHAGYEMFPRFSPDGKYIAFTGQYDGNTEVYLMPSQGGVPKRLTYTALLERDDVSDRMGPNNIVMGWKSNSREIVFRSRMIEPNSFNGQLFITDIDGDLPTELPLPRGGFCSFSPDGSRLAFNRVFREFRTWKRYRGGMADDIWIYDFKTRETINLTDNPAQDIIPMWNGDDIYFLSDRDENERMNLYVCHLKDRTTEKLTDFKEFDIKFPSLGDRAIAFENGGFIYLYDLNDKSLKKVTVFIQDDRLGARKELVNVQKNISTFEISPDGKRALFNARGDIFTVPAKYGNIRNLTHSSGIHERNPKWSPDGKWIAYISDRSGENEIYIQNQDGISDPVRLTTGADTYMYEITWSPDSKKIMWSDKKLRLSFVDVESRQVTGVAQASFWEIRDYCWSPDSRWICYSLREANAFNTLYLYSLEHKKNFRITENWHYSTAPAFGPEGKYLFFVSARDFQPVYSWTEYNNAYLDMMRIYLIPLGKKTLSPFEPKSDEVSVSPNKDMHDKKKTEKKTSKTEPAVLEVDLEGIQDRIISLPSTPSNYWHLTPVKNKLYYLRNGSKDKDTVMLVYDLQEQKETELGTVKDYEISADRKKMLVGADKSYAIIDLPSAPFKIEQSLDLSTMETGLCHICEWKQIFDECWRQMRDFFYVANMNGVDWKKIHDQYAGLLKYVNHRNDLTYIIGEMIGELNSGHTYVGGGERPDFKKIETGLLGARLQRDGKTGFYRIDKIIKGQDWDKDLVSPLTRIGLNVKAGDYIVAVNGRSTSGINNIYSALVHQAGKQVKLKVNTIPDEKNSREIVVVPVRNEQGLYYYNWVQDNIRKVDEATNGRVGYIHIPDMGTPGLNEFAKTYYPQLRKKALIVDVRGNGGGSVSPMIVERLRREIAMIDMARNTSPTLNPDGMLWGPMVCLIDEFSASDGDIFPYRFKKYKLGKLIGKRTWGGVVGIRDSLPLLDGGFLYKPEFASYDEQGKGWIIEGHGVDPDIVVDNDPAKEFAGIDQQLNKAIEVILEELKTREKTIPPIPEPPDKSVKTGNK
jgi:tricorn protease